MGINSSRISENSYNHKMPLLENPYPQYFFNTNSQAQEAAIPIQANPERPIEEK